jgi:deferrochelatase/peroxidase EfeB
MKSRHQSLHPSRRGFLTAAAAGLLTTAASEAPGRAFAASQPVLSTGDSQQSVEVEPFWGPYQTGIATPQQKHTYFAVFDLEAKTTRQIVELMRVWTAAAARLTSSEEEAPSGALTLPGFDSGEGLGLEPARLTVTFGFGAGLFIKDGHDRYGLASARPAALVDLPKFNGDQLEPGHTGGDVSVQASADDPQVAFHAVRQLARLAYGVASLRWTQAGFASRPAKGTPRNLMGFKDGTQQPQSLDEHVWVSADGDHDWMRQGSYLVVRKIRIALEHWDRTPVDFQEQIVGRHKFSGAPLGAKDEFDTLNLEATDPDGNPIIPDNAHVRLAAAASNDGAQMLRRAYAYNDGTNFTAERWPPWRQGLEYDAGLLFISYQRDPRTGFIKIFDKMSKLDAMNQFTTHIGSGLFACPGGVAKGEFIGQRLFGTT